MVFSPQGASPRAPWQCRANKGSLSPTHSLSTSRSLGLIEKVSANNEPPDLTGSRPNLIKLGVPQQPSRGILVDVTVPAQDLNRVQSHCCRALCREQDACCAVLCQN